MSPYIVDASVAAKWFFNEAYTDAAIRLLDTRHPVHVPDLFFVELDNVVCKRVRRGEISAAEGRKVRAALRRLPAQAHGLAALRDPAYEIALRTGCSLCDGLYVALAALLKGCVVTADRRLCEALAEGPFSKCILWVEDVPE